MRTVDLTSNYIQVVPQSTGNNDIGYGQNVAVSDSYMAVSAIRYDSNELPDSGALYVYSLDQQGVPIESSVITITPSDLQAGDLFSDPVKIVGTQLITTSITKGAGKVYIYDLQNPAASERSLTPPNGMEGDKYGSSFDMTLDGQFLFIGAAGSDLAKPNGGVVYCYSLTEDGTYKLYHVLEPPTSIVGAGFGRYVELTDDQLIIGSQNSNALYVFDTLTLVVEDVILPSKVGGPVSGFGVPIDVYEDVMVVGARDSFQGVGTAMVYQNVDGDDWVFQGYVFDKSFSSGRLGISVSVGDGIIAVSPKDSNIYRK
jgi:hypothetical protein